MHRTITIKGKEASLAGRLMKVGMIAPEILENDTDLNEVRLRDFQGKVKILTSFFSLDTPVCDLQVKTFNRKAADLSQDVIILAISKDMPFAQKRYCEANAVSNLRVLSDYKYSYFGSNYGVLLWEEQVLARATFVLDVNNIVRYAAIVPELTHEPDYDSALSAVRDVLEKPSLGTAAVPFSHCIPCTGGTPPLSPTEIEELMRDLTGWSLVEGKKLVKEYAYSDYLSAKKVMDLASVVADEQGHHPWLTLSYNKVKVTLTTHAANGLTPNDFLMATLLDELAE